MAPGERRLPSKRHDLRDPLSWPRIPQFDAKLREALTGNFPPSIECINKVGPLDTAACLTLTNLRRLVELAQATPEINDKNYIQVAIGFISENMDRMGMASSREIQRTRNTTHLH